MRMRIFMGMTGLSLVLLAAASLLFINATKIVSILLSAVLLLQMLIMWHQRKKTSSIMLNVAIASGLLLLMECAYLVYPHYYLLAVNAWCAVALGSGLMVSQWRFRNVRKHRKIISWVALLIFGLPCLALVSSVLTLSIKPGIGIHLFFGESNSAQPLHPSKQTELQDGTTYINDLQYGDDYPNSFLDIYLPKDEPMAQKPTYIFIHGGGFVAGDKLEEWSNLKYYTSLTDAGYKVIAINYAFAPEYPYPVPLQQISGAIDFLKENQEKYGLDLDHVIVSGNSAGGNISGQFVLMQTDQHYADKMGVKPVLNKEAIKGVVFHSTLYEPAKFNQSKDSTLKNYFWDLYGRAYWGNDYKNNEAAKQADIVEHITKNYPPVFLSDGNYASFYDQAYKMERKLTQLGIEHESNVYSRKAAILPHGYEVSYKTKFAKKNMEKMLRFMEEHMN